MGASRAGSYEVTPPGRSRAHGTTHQDDESIERQQDRVRLTVSQTQQVVPRTSSLATGTRGSREPSGEARASLPAEAVSLSYVL